MKRWPLAVLLALFMTMVPGAASAQDEDDYLDRYAFGIGIGQVDLSDSRSDDSTETYFGANFRILIGDKNAGRDDKSVVAYVEPEIGYWERGVRIPVGDGTANSDASDMVVGVNILGLVPFQRVDYFFGAGIGIHFFDAGLDTSGIELSSDETFGVNIQVGIDVHLGDALGVFALMRLDLIEEAQGAQIGEEQAKIVVGLRFSFG